MEKKNNPNIQRAKELYACEKEMLGLLDKYSVMLPEAVFMFERMKFSAFLSSENEGRKRHEQETIKAFQTMFR